MLQHCLMIVRINTRLERACIGLTRSMLRHVQARSHDTRVYLEQKPHSSKSTVVPCVTTNKS